MVIENATLFFSIALHDIGSDVGICNVGIWIRDKRSKCPVMMWQLRAIIRVHCVSKLLVSLFLSFWRFALGFCVWLGRHGIEALVMTNFFLIVWDLELAYVGGNRELSAFALIRREPILS